MTNRGYVDAMFETVICLLMGVGVPVNLLTYGPPVQSVGCMLGASCASSSLWYFGAWAMSVIFFVIGVVRLAEVMKS